MSTFLAPVKNKLPISWRRIARNGKPASWVSPLGAALMSNHVAAYRKKQFFWHSQDPTAIPANATDADQTYWRCHVHTGHQTSAIEFVTVLALASATTDDAPSAQWVEAGGAGPDSEIFYHKYKSSPTDFQEQWHTDSQIIAVDPDTDYEFNLVIGNHCRPIAASGWELADYQMDSTDTGVSPQDRFFVDGPVISDDVAAIATAQENLWKHNGACLAAWTHPTGSYVNNATNTYTNIFDGSTSVTSTTIGFRFKSAYRGRIDSDNVPIRMAAYIANVGAGGVCALRDNSGNVLSITVGGTGTAGWYYGTGNLDAASDLQKLDVMMRKGTVASYIRLYAFAIYQYEA